MNKATRTITSMKEILFCMLWSWKGTTSLYDQFIVNYHNR